MITYYKDFLIAEDYPDLYSREPRFIFFPASEGINHDYDLIGEDYKYCGNCRWTDSLEEAKADIDDFLLMMKS